MKTLAPTEPGLAGLSDRQRTKILNTRGVQPHRQLPTPSTYFILSEDNGTRRRPSRTGAHDEALPVFATEPPVPVRSARAWPATGDDARQRRSRQPAQGALDRLGSCSRPDQGRA